VRLILFQPEIAPNAGAAIRTAACFGAGVDIIEPCGFPADARGLKRAALDYGALAPPVLHASWRSFLESPERASGRLILLTTKASASLWDCRFEPTDLLMIGQESAGAPDEVRAKVDAAIRIPIVAPARSLNAAASGAIALAEAARQIARRGGA
jgi:tRNA (cytidine/uridine-2'-O-)-methyltransferase